jgi:hypothetical protein
MDVGYFIAERQPDGRPGKPAGNDDGAIMVFEELDPAKSARDRISREISREMAIYKLSIRLVGEVAD